MLSKAVDTHLFQLFTAAEGREFAEVFVPFWKDILNNQDSKVVQAFLLHMYKMTMSIEASVVEELHQKGEQKIALTQLEVKKLIVFATRIQNRSDKDVATYFEMIKHLICEVSQIEYDAHDPIWETIIKEIQSTALEHANKVSPEQLSGSAIKVLRSTATYYIEELAAATDLEYDPISSLPPGIIRSYETYMIFLLTVNY